MANRGVGSLVESTVLVDHKTLEEAMDLTDADAIRKGRLRWVRLQT